MIDTGGSSSASSLRGADLRGGRLAGHGGFSARWSEYGGAARSCIGGARRLADAKTSKGRAGVDLGVGVPGGPEAGCLAAGSRADTPALQDGGFSDDEEGIERGREQSGGARGASLRGGRPTGGRELL